MELFLHFYGFKAHFYLFWVICSDFGWFSGILKKNLKYKMAEPRWRLFRHHDVIVTWYDVAMPRDVYRKKEFWTYNISYKFHGDCLNFLQGLNRVKQI